MNLTKLFDMQKALDAHIKCEKGLEGQSLLDKKILALQVELGELANEWRGFKFWSEDQEPRTKVPKYPTMNYEDIEWKNPLLEEYVDCLHFILSIGVELGFESARPHLVYVKDPLEMFSKVFIEIARFAVTAGREHKKFYYDEILSNFLGLGKSLEFTWEQIEQAYISKNEINHQRQETGY